MKMRLLAAGALILATSLTYSSASTPGASDTKKEEAKAAETPKVAGRRSAKTSSADGKIISPYSLAQRTALNRRDCKPNNLHKDGLGMHGHYRTYGQWDPELKSIEGRQQYEACVKRGLDPTPWFAVGQRLLIATNGKFFGKTKDDCLKCHSNY